MPQPASLSISRLSSRNGKSRSSASIRPSVDLPAPRRPIRAIREARPGTTSPAALPSRSPSAMRARCSVASSRLANRSRRSSHSGVASSRSSAKRHWRPRVTCNRTRMDALPTPLSRLARWRSETSVASASALRVIPRRARKTRTRSPSALRNGSFRSPGSGGAAGPLRRSQAARVAQQRPARWR